MEYLTKKTLLAGLVTAVIFSSANAATFTVTKTADTRDGSCNADCSLREAIDAANASLGPDVVILPAGDYQITLPGAAEDANATGDFDILEDLEIQGAGNAVTAISGEGAYKILDVNGTSAPISLSVSGVTFKYADLAAVDFYGTGSLDIDNTVFTKNYNEFGYGASVEVRGNPTLTVNNTVFTDNCSRSAPAIDGEGTWSISNSTFSNHGGWFESPFVTGDDCPIDAYGGGGAIYMQYADVTIDKSSFVDNESDGGGAIYAHAGSLTITNTTMANNTATGPLSPWGGGYGGGAIEVHWADVTIVNSTLTGNQSLNNEGGAINVRNVAPWGTNSVTLVNTIVAGNTAPTGPDCFGIVTSTGGTLLGDATGCTYTPGAGDLSGDPGLDVFTDDGTPGNGHYPLLSSSQAIDAGNNATCAADDQIGTVRAGNCDIGAIEYALQAVNDIVTVPMGLTYIDVMENDKFPDPDTVIKSVSAVSPAVGFAGIFGDQIAFYRLAPGEAEFTYTLEEPSGATSTATVEVK